MIIFKVWVMELHELFYQIEIFYPFPRNHVGQLGHTVSPDLKGIQFGYIIGSNRILEQKNPIVTKQRTKVRHVY